MIFIRLALLTLILFLSAPMQLQAQDGTISTETGTELAEQDAAMAVKIREIIGDLDGFDDITVVVRSGMVLSR